MAGDTFRVGAGRWIPGTQRAVEMPPSQRRLTLGEGKKPDFSQTLSKVLAEVNELQVRSDKLIEDLAAGRSVDIHEVMIAQQEADLAFRLIQEIRDKLIAAYQELMRTQI